jgi:vancomycin resistance protein YoaR
VLVLAAGALLLGSTSDIPPRVSIGGVDVGGMSADDARQALEEHATRRLQGRVRFTAADDESVAITLDAGTVASAAKIDEALAAARDARGRFGSALAQLGLAGRKELPLNYALEDQAVRALVRDVGIRLGETAVSATVALDGEEIVATPARPGRAVDRAALVAALATLPSSVAITTRPAEPAADDEDARRARDLATRVVATTRQVTLDGRTASLGPQAVRDALRFPIRKGTIAVELDPDALRATLVRPLGVTERAPTDARLRIRGDRVVVVPSLAGRRLDGASLGAAIVRDPEAATVAAAVTTAKPEFTTAEARALGVREKVSEFTTPYACCQPRVRNIQRAAAILDGTVLGAGERFSLNDALGERVASRGFVEAPAIAAGELVDTVGGGVSQVATTMYNAAFFAGLALEAHTPHEFYISRYPMGREATVSWRQPDLVFRNDWDAAILMSVRAASNGITVAFYSSTLGRRVETTTGQPTNRTAPKTIERSKPDLPPGTRRVVQSAGAGGFAISYMRKVYAGKRLKRDETFRWTYRPENAIVEVGPPKVEPEEPPAPTMTSPLRPPTTTIAPPRTTPAPPATTGPAPPLP